MNDTKYIGKTFRKGTRGQKMELKRYKPEKTITICSHFDDL